MPITFTALPSLNLRHVVSLKRLTSGFNDYCLKRNVSGELEKKGNLMFGRKWGKDLLYLKPSSFYFIKTLHCQMHFKAGFSQSLHIIEARGLKWKSLSFVILVWQMALS